jgi:predicted phage terminase large subunit-like protein
MNDQKHELRELLRLELCKRDFWRFCVHYDPDFFAKRTFMKRIANAFQRIESREIKSLAVSLPPRAGKSYITSLFCAWTIGRNPNESVMRNSCTATLYLKFSYDVRSIVKSDKFKMVFPDVQLSDDKANLQGWNTNKSKMVGYFGAGVGGTIIGFGASNVAITDDLYRGIEDAMSDTTNDRVIQWKESTHDSRFERGCVRIDIGTRWSINDMIGRNIEREIYDEMIIVPALDENDETFCADVLSSDDYIEKRKQTAPEIWLAEYQQQPVDVKGRLFNDMKMLELDEFNSIVNSNKTEINPSGIDGAFAYVDVADAGTDFTACAIAVVIRDQWFVVDYIFTRENTDITIPLIAQKLDQWSVSYCRVESNNVGAMFGRMVQKLTKTRILLVPNTTNKITRIIMQSAFVMNDFHFVKTIHPQRELFIANMISFTKDGKNKNDDAPDCICGLSMFMRGMFKK